MIGFSYDVMGAAGYGYQRVWAERSYLFRLALIPTLIKFAAFIAVFVLDYQGNYLRQGLVLLPASFAEGWLVAQFLRTLIRGERWPTVLDHEPDAATIERLLLRARGIVSATLVYVLIALVEFVGLFAIGEAEKISQAQLQLMQTGAPAEVQDSAAQNPLMFVPGVLLLLGSIWALRLMWVFIPYSVLMPIRTYLKKIAGFGTSLRMMAVFLVCLVPPMFLVVMFARIVVSALAGTGLVSDGAALSQFIILFFNVIAEIVVVLLSTAAMTFAMRDILPKAQGELEPLPNKQMW